MINDKTTATSENRSQFIPILSESRLQVKSIQINGKSSYDSIFNNRVDIILLIIFKLWLFYLHNQYL